MKSKVNKNMLELIPFIKMDDNYIKMKHGYLEMIQIESKNIFSRSESIISLEINKFNKFLKAYPDDFKIIIMNYPVNTEKQQQYIQDKIENCKNKLHLSFLEDKLQELKSVQATKTNIEYYIFIFGDDKEKLNQNIDSFKRLFKSASFFIIDKAKKQDILFKLNNMNTKI